MASIKLKGDVSGEVTISAPAVAGTTTLTLPTTSSTIATQNSLGVRNRIINGDMRIDQRNAGASVTITTDSTFTLDRWMCEVSQASKFSVQQDAAAVTPPAGFNDYLGVTSLSSYSVGTSDYFTVMQRIEGYNVANLDFGKATAKTITISFWVRSSLTGTFGGSIGNSAENRSYPFSYTISAANTWEQKTITIAGDTTGTWLITNGRGLNVRFSLGMGSTFTDTANAWTTKANVYSATGATSVVGTSGATFYITGVQLEVGTEATPFEHRPFDMEFQRCQRYYQKYTATFDKPLCNATYYNTTSVYGVLHFNATMRAHPTGSVSSLTALRVLGQELAKTSTEAFIGNTTLNSAELVGTVSAGTAGYSAWIRASGNMYVDFSAEL